MVQLYEMMMTRHCVVWTGGQSGPVVRNDDDTALCCGQVDKVVQLYETMMTRHCTMIVGPTGGGKSVVLNTLCQAQTK